MYFIIELLLRDSLKSNDQKAGLNCSTLLLVAHLTLGIGHLDSKLVS